MPRLNPLENRDRAQSEDIGRIHLVLCIPAYNEERIISDTISHISTVLNQRAGLTWSIIVSENGSTDKTVSEVSDMHIPNVEIVKTNYRGKGKAIRQGLSARSADLWGFTDADLSVEPTAINNMLDIISTTKVNVVVGSRMHPETKSDRGIVRVWSSIIFDTLAHFITGVSYRDIQCPLKIMDRKGLEQLLSCVEEGWFIDLEFILRCEKNKLQITEIPIFLRESFYRERKSKVSLVRDSLKAIFAMFRIRRNLRKEASPYTHGKAIV